MHDPKLYEMRGPAWLRWLIAIALFGVYFWLVYFQLTHEASATSEPSFDNSGLSVQRTFNTEGWKGPTGYWEPHSIPKKTCDWVKNPNYVPGGKKPRYIQLCVTHWLAAWVPVNDVNSQGGQVQGAGLNGSAVDWFRSRSAQCYLGQAKFKVTQHLNAGLIDINTGAVLYWGKVNEKVCVGPNGGITYHGPVEAHGDTGTTGDLLQWSGPCCGSPDTGMKNMSVAGTRWTSHWRMNALFQFKQCASVAKLGCARFRTDANMLKGDFYGTNGAIIFVPSVNGITY